MSCRRPRDRACRQSIRGLPTELSRGRAGRIVKRQGRQTGKTRAAGLPRERTGRQTKKRSARLSRERTGKQTRKKEAKRPKR